VEGIVPGDDYRVSVGDQSAVVTPGFDGADVGTLTLVDEDDAAVKVTVKDPDRFTHIFGSDSQDPYWNFNHDLMTLIDDGRKYEVELAFTNSSATGRLSNLSYTIVPETGMNWERDGVYYVPVDPNGTGGLSTTTVPNPLRPEFGFRIPIRVFSTAAITFPPGEEYVILKLNITIDADELEEPLEDSVDFRFYRNALTFNVTCTSNTEINGMVIVPGGKSYFFKVSGDSSSTPFAESLRFPRSGAGDKDYLLMMFLPNSSSSASSYSIGVNTAAPSALSPDSEGPSNDTEDTAASLNENSTVIGRLSGGDVDYYRIKLVQ
jgi:hypothetical protein